MNSDSNSWQVFEETGDPLAYVLYRARRQMEAGEELGPEQKRKQREDREKISANR
ncbi:MAG: YqzL family protein [Firmicutes bacterium]|nr:YqzL family protein [Bacillota bacterium]